MVQHKLDFGGNLTLDPPLDCPQRLCSMANLRSLDSAAVGEQTYVHRLVLTDGVLKQRASRVGSATFEERVDSLSGFTIAGLKSIFLQLYHTSPSVLWAANLTIGCHR